MANPEMQREFVESGGEKQSSRAVRHVRKALRNRHARKDPDKRAAALACSNEFYFVAPKDLIQPEEVPAECGLIEVDDRGRTRQKVKAPWRDAEISPALLVAIAKAAS